MSGLARLWRLLTEAPTAVSESGRRRQIQLLSGLLVVLIPLVLLLIGLQLLLFPGSWPSPVRWPCCFSPMASRVSENSPPARC
jgi:hypothetical protein